MSPFIEKRYNVFDIAEREGVDTSEVLDWCKRGLRNTPNLADGSIEIAASDLREFLDSRRNGGVTRVEADESDRLVPIAEYAEQCDIDPKHVEKWIDEGLPVHERGGVWYVNRDEVLDFLKPALAEIHNDHSHGTHSDGTTRSESTGNSVIVAEAGIPLSEIFN